MSDGRQFSGFRLPTTTPVPDELFDEWLPVLGHAELKVLLYIIRRVLGFKKQYDAIAYSQFLHGIKRKDGTVLDRGCGIKSATNLNKALEGLEAKGLITVMRETTQAGDPATTKYALHFSDEALTQQQYPTDRESGPALTQQQRQETVNKKQSHKGKDIDDQSPFLAYADRDVPWET